MFMAFQAKSFGSICREHLTQSSSFGVNISEDHSRCPASRNCDLPLESKILRSSRDFTDSALNYSESQAERGDIWAPKHIGLKCKVALNEENLMPLLSKQSIVSLEEKHFEQPIDTGLTPDWDYLDLSDLILQDNGFNKLFQAPFLELHYLNNQYIDNLKVEIGQTVEMMSLVEAALQQEEEKNIHVKNQQLAEQIRELKQTQEFRSQPKSHQSYKGSSPTHGEKLIFEQLEQERERSKQLSKKLLKACSKACKLEKAIPRKTQLILSNEYAGILEQKKDFLLTSLAMKAEYFASRYQETMEQISNYGREAACLDRIISSPYGLQSRRSSSKKLPGNNRSKQKKLSVDRGDRSHRMENESKTTSKKELLLNLIKNRRNELSGSRDDERVGLREL